MAPRTNEERAEAHTDAEIAKLRAQLHDCEMSLKIFDAGHSSEYWERHPVQPSNE